MWYFRKKARGEKIRNPIQGEFFAQDAISGPAQALVRESVQNSLDAAADKLPVRVCIKLATGDSSLPASAVAEMFSQAWPHLGAPGNGLRYPPTPTSTCPYLLIEDYGTNGLTGNTSQSDADPDPTVKNPFFMFFRAEGLSAKSGTALGRWGVGKFVFPRSSLASTHFGVTVRHDDHRRLLLGAVTLKAHHIDGLEGTYTPDGLYGNPRDDGFVDPIEDAASIDRFCNLFGVTRTIEPGLSVVVPFLDPEEITYDALLHAAVRDYFLPVLNGRLEITVRDSASSAVLTKDTLTTVLSEYEDLAQEMLPLIELAQLASGMVDSERILLEMPDPARAARWSESIVSSGALGMLRKNLMARIAVAVRVPITVRDRAVGDRASYFDMYLKPDRNSDGRPVFLREGIIISDVRGKRAREVRSLVVIEDKPLAGMLGDSENPAHTQWQRDSSNFKGKYTYGKAVIEFVTDSVGELLGIVNRSSQQADPSLTIDFFSIDPPDDEEETEEAATHRRREKKGKESTDDNLKIKGNPTRIGIQRCAGGFAIVAGASPPKPPYLIEVRCGYEIRSGNPLKRWDAADFTLGNLGLPIVCEGPVRVLNTKGNHAILRVDGPEFRASLDGFDTNRDVFVRAEIREASDAGTEA